MTGNIIRNPITGFPEEKALIENVKSPNISEVGNKISNTVCCNMVKAFPAIVPGVCDLGCQTVKNKTSDLDCKKEQTFAYN